MTELNDALTAIIEDLDLAPEPSAAVDAEVRAHVADLRLDEGTVDETHVPYVTIDNPDSRDLDQAVHVAPRDGGWTVRYAIADAAFYVPAGSALWQRSLAQGSSYYLPGRAIPMLPVEMSEGIVSLNPDVDRRAVRFAMDVDADGQCADVRVARIRMCSRGKLSYEGVQAWLDGEPTYEAGRVDAAVALHDEIEPSLYALLEVGEALLAAAQSRDTTPIDRVESSIDVDPDDPSRLRVTARERLDVERYNEQISLLFNIEGARLLERLSRSTQDVQAVYRVHLPPLTERLDSLAQILDALARRRALDDAWTWRRGAGELGDFVRALPDDGATRRLRRAVHRQVRYTFRSSAYRSRSGPHHALGVDGYVRLSAPMREVVGVFTHKELAEGIGWAPPHAADEDALTRDAVIAAAQRSRQTQRAVDKQIELLAIRQMFDADLALPDRQRPSRLATVIGVRSSRLYVALDGFALDVKIYVQDLEAQLGTELTEVDDVALVDADGRARFVLGDGVAVQVERWDGGRQRFVLRAERLADTGGD